ncbi:MAG: hypothetical protein LBQ31_09335 [Bacteroidales bacterium]|nr:hypothetical protein [Bacteroidales bacterium]
MLQAIAKNSKITRKELSIILQLTPRRCEISFAATNKQGDYKTYRVK